MTPPLSLAEAQALLLDKIEALPAEPVAVESALGRHAGEDVVATRTQPAADLSAMDGYAVGAGDVAGPWQVVGESAAGRPFSGELRGGEAVRISTGALMPAGAGAVLLQENAQRDGSTLVLNGEGEPTPRHVRRQGFDFRTGDLLVPAGARIGPAQMALAISGGQSHLAVHARPSVVVIDSGDELAADPGDCEAHQIPASNGAMLAAMVAPHAAAVRRIGPVSDRLEALVAALDNAADADVIVTSGGASVGDHDLVRPALEQWGASIQFWRVAMKPGKPLLVARRGTQVVLGLPGNPVSSYVTAFLFLLPLLRKLGGAREALPHAVPLPLGSALAAGGDRTEFVRARLNDAGVTPIDEQDSSALAALARAEWLIERPAGAAPAAAGEPVRAYWLDYGGIA
jgi:molybdopterin molybdotransferase